MLFSRRRRLEVELIDALLTGELERRKAQAGLDEKLAEIELRKRTLELEHLTTIADEKRKDGEARAKLREQRQLWAANARARRKQNLSRRDAEGCRVCANQGDPSLTASEISWHHAGHPGEAAS